MNFNFDTGTIDTIQTIDCSLLPPLGGTAGVLTIIGTGAILLPQGTTLEEPVGVAGMFRYNTDTNLLEYFDSTTWSSLAATAAAVASVNLSTSSGPAVTVSTTNPTGPGVLLTVDVSASLQALSTLGASASSGVLVQTGVGTFVDRTITGTAGNIVVTNGSGVAGNPTVNLATAGTPVSASFVKITTDTFGRVTATTAVTSSDITTALGYTPVNKAGDTNVGSLAMGSNQNITFNGGTVTGLPTPVNATDATNKSYVDGLAAGITAKAAVRASTIANLAVTAAGTGATHTLTANANGALVLDGITLAVADRVLVKNQTTTSDNGVYVVTATGDGSNPFVLTRSTDFNGVSPGIVAAGDFVFVEDGTTLSDTGWVVYVPGNVPIVVDTDPITWTQFTGTGAVTLAFAADSGSPDVLVSGQTLHIVGTSNQVSTIADGTNNITISLPQDIATSSSPTFVDVTLTGLTANGVVTTNGSSALASTALTNGQLLIGSTGTAAVASTLTAGTAISVTNGAGSITIANTGVTSAIAGTGISVSGATGAVTIGNTGVLSITGTANQITASASTGAITLSVPSTFIAPGSVEVTTTLQVDGNTAKSFVYSNASKQLVTTAAPTNGQLLIGSTGNIPVAAALTAGTGISVTNGAGSITVANTGVTSVALSDASTTPIYSVSGSPVTTTGTLTITLSTQSANTVFAGPTSGGAAQPTFRGLVYADIAGSALKLYAENASSPVAPSATGTNAVAIGSGSTASATGSTAIGSGTNASIFGSLVTANGSFATAGDAQAGTYVLRNITTNNTATELFLDGTAATQRLVVPNNSVVTFDIFVSARRTDTTGGGAGYSFLGVIRKDGTAGSTTSIGAISKTIIGETNAAWDASVTADTTNGSIKVTVTGENAKTIRWVAVARTAEVTN